MKNILSVRRSLQSGVVLIVTATVGHAAPPEVPTPAPYIVLADNLDEPNGYGFCIDTDGRGKSDLLHAHTCKPVRPGQDDNPNDNDTRFFYDAATQRVEAFAYEGFCMQALISRGRTEFALLDCTDHPRQRFVLDPDAQTLALAEDTTRCLSVSDETIPAGPWVKRHLRLAPCGQTDAALLQWSVVYE